jgi:CSLREA domain-containing protein
MLGAVLIVGALAAAGPATSAGAAPGNGSPGGRPAATPSIASPRPPAVAPTVPAQGTAPSKKDVAAAKADSSKVLGPAPEVATSSSTTFVVTSTVDSPLANPTGTTCVDLESTPACSLRAAVEAANNLDGPVVIDLSSSTYVLTNTSLGPLTVENPGGTSIEGSGATSTKITVPSGKKYGVVNLTANGNQVGGALWLTDLSLSGGDATYGGGLAIEDAGDSAILDHVDVTGNTAEDGGGIACGTHEDGGSLWVTDSTISGNTATKDGGGIDSYWCGIQLTSTTVVSNTAKDADGGGIYEDFGALTATGGNISSNTAGVATATAGSGGGIYNVYGLNTFTDVAVNNDTAESNGSGDSVGGGDEEYFSQLTATGGSFTGDTALGAGCGGGLELEYGAQVTLHGVTVTHDSTQATSSDSTEGGGGIYAFGYDYATSLVIDDGSSISDNLTGGIVDYNYYGGSTVRISNSTLSGNTSPIEYHGGAITDYGEYYGGDTLTLDDDTINSNSESGDFSAGAVFSWADEYEGQNTVMNGDTLASNSSSGEEGSGAVIVYSEEYANATLDATGSTFSANTAPTHGLGGAIDAYSEDEYSPVEVNLTSDVLADNSAGSTAKAEEGYGGAVYDEEAVTTTITNSELNGNSAVGTATNSTDAAAGGAVYTDSYQSASYTGDLITGNKATGVGSYGGGIYDEDEAGLSLTRTTISDNAAVYGAGDYQGTDGYTVRLVDSTVSGNVAGDATAAGYGGGFYLDNSVLDATDSTIADNVAVSTAKTSGYGGGLYDRTSGAITFDFSTIAGNAAGTGAGIYGAGSSGTLKASIVADNMTTPGGKTEADCAFLTTSTTTILPTPLTSSGDNVLSQSSCVDKLSFGDQVTKHAGIEGLAPNSGPNETSAPYPTETVALLPGSPAIDAAGTQCPTTDERGVTRPQLTACDSGAFELGEGLWDVASDGGVFSLGSAAYYGSMGGKPLNDPVVGVAATPDAKGYWEVASDGGLFSFGDAAFFGSMGGKPLNKPVVGMTATATGGGYWEVASDGGIFAFGNAPFYGSMGGRSLNEPIVGMAATPTGGGYWEVASDGGIFAFGNATFFGSMGGKALNAPIVGISPTVTGGGYWEVASDGGIFAFGNAGYLGSMGGKSLNAPIVSIATSPDSNGYWEVASDGGMFNFGDARFLGSLAGISLNAPIVGSAAA